jgi:excisionase family DNA binding protein
MPQYEPVPGDEKSLLIDAAAQSLGVSRRTIYYMIREGRLQTIRTRCGSQRVLVSSIELLRGAGRPARARRGIRWVAGASLRDQDAGA